MPRTEDESECEVYIRNCQRFHENKSTTRTINPRCSERVESVGYAVAILHQLSSLVAHRFLI